MRKLFCVLAVLLGVSLFSGQAFAAVGAFDSVCHGDVVENGTVVSPSTLNSSVCTGDTGTNPITGGGGILMKAINLLAFLTGIASIIIIIIGGIKYVLSTGDPGKVASAKDTILYAVVGLVVSVTARGIILFLVNRLK